MRANLFPYLFLILIAFLTPINTQCQSGHAGITGVVRDPANHGISAAAIRVRQAQTGFTRSATTNAAGVFMIDGLLIGTYSIEVSHAGFSPARSGEIELMIGQTRNLNIKLQLSGLSQRLDVQATASEIDVASAALGSFVVRDQLNNLPMNGRNWTTLLPLMPGATDPGSSDQRTVRFAGHGRDDNNITYDGVDATGISNQPQKTGIRLAIPSSAIAEFKVDSALYSAASADGAGGQVILASVGGTNAFHGELFEFLRNDVFDARNPFASSNPRFHLNQFGANFGGPVRRDKTFFFVAFEGSRQSLDQSLQGFTPSAAFRAGVLAQILGIQAQQRCVGVGRAV